MENQLEVFKEVAIEALPQNYQKYLPNQTKAADFESFWEQTLDELKKIPLHITRESVAYPSAYFQVEKITFQSLYNETIVGWYILPKHRSGRIPCLIEYLGYLSRRGEPFQYAHWAQLGLAVLVFDVRGQGGDTADSAPYKAPTMNFPMGKGLLNKEDYYQRRVYCDSVREIEVACTLEEIDEQAIFLNGASQGGALVLAASALTTHPLPFVMADVPSSCDVEKRIQEETGSYQEITQFLRNYPDAETRVLKVQSYFDLKNFAENIQVPVFASVGGKDPVCPPLNFCALYNRLTCEKRLSVYPHNHHDGGGSSHMRKKMQLITTYLKQQNKFGNK